MTHSTAQVAFMLQVSPRKVEGWAARGILRPAMDKPGTGTARRYTTAEVILAAVMLHTQETLGVAFMRPGHIATLIRRHCSPARLLQDTTVMFGRPTSPISLCVNLAAIRKQLSA